MAYSSPVLLEPLQEEKAKCDNHNAVMCDYCNGFYAKAIFRLHKHRCTAAKAGMTSVSVPLSTATQSRTNFHKQFFTSGCSCQALSNGWVHHICRKAFVWKIMQKTSQTTVRCAQTLHARHASPWFSGSGLQKVASKDGINCSAEDMLNQ